MVAVGIEPPAAVAVGDVLRVAVLERLAFLSVHGIILPQRVPAGSREGGEP